MAATEAVTVTVKEIMEKGSVPLPEARKMMGCSQTTLYEMIKDRSIPYIGGRGDRKIPVAAIEKYLAQVLVQS